jgi:branched-chain amino acid transport system permease protein
VGALLAVLIDGLVYSSWLFTTAVGLTLIYGVMKILNMAHGSLYALGAYASASLVGYWLAHGGTPPVTYALLAVAALLVGIIGGVLIERGLLRFLYGKDEIVLLLVTYAVFLILEDAVKLVWGVESYYIPAPYEYLRNIKIGGLIYPLYNALLIVIATLSGLALAWFLNGTRQGKLLRAVIHDREVSLAMGINVERMYVMTFTIGCVLAALAGAFNAPTMSIVPGMGAEVIVLAFAVVVIGGLGSIAGAALGALLVGMVRSASVRYVPELELFSIYLVMALVLILRPRGLFSPPETRKI